jgi:AraC-like DNA-binding protein
MSVDGLTASPRGGAPLPEVYLYGGLFAAAVGAFCLAQLVGPRLGLASDVLAVAGDATCGWSWLLVRALFQPPRARRAIWPLALVLTLVATGAVLRLTGDGETLVPRMIGNLGALVSSTLLLLAALEPLMGLGRDAPRGERVFRIAFAACYAAVLAVAVVWVDGAPAGGWVAREGLAIKTACAVIALVGMAFAVWRRRRHPLAEPGRARRRGAAADVDGLGPRILALMAEEAVLTRPSLKVADLARRLGEPDYKVTRAVTGALGFRNFNHMANQFRIEEARRRLGDPAFAHLPVLTLAFDCGFASIGPFNRAFKAQTGLTPIEYRRKAGGGSP